MADAAGLLRVDMHVHTRTSLDSLNPPEGIVAAMDAAGIDRAVICDHNRLEGALRLRDQSPGRILVGEEVKTREGPDIIGIFLSELIPKGTPLVETCERIRAQGGLVYVPHPFDTRRSGAGEMLDSIAHLVDAVEAHNARTFRPGLNQRGEAWAVEHGVPLGAGSDAHTLGEIGAAYVEVPPFEPTRDSFLAALAAGRVAGRGVSPWRVTLASSYARVHKVIFRG